jgi:hypothetical protein
MGIFNLSQDKLFIYRVQAPYVQESHLEALVSRKGGNCEVTSEESETTKLGTDEHFFVMFYW